MKIYKIGHCCLLIDVKGVRILTDPGTFTSGQEKIFDIDAVIITHEHADHFHIESLKKVLANNSNLKVFTNSAVGEKLDGQGIQHVVLGGKDADKNSRGDHAYVGKVKLEAFDCRHEEIYKEIGQVQNTAYFIDDRLFYPGDSFFNPREPVEILALPVAGPWCRISDAIRYALDVAPKKAFPVHDGMIQTDKLATCHRVPGMVLKENNIEFIDIKEGEMGEF